MYVLQPNVLVHFFFLFWKASVSDQYLHQLPCYLYTLNALEQNQIKPNSNSK